LAVLVDTIVRLGLNNHVPEPGGRGPRDLGTDGAGAPVAATRPRASKIIQAQGADDETSRTGGAAVAGVSAHDAALMAQAAQQVESAVGAIRGQQAQLASAHDSMMTGWKGTAASTFTSAYNEFNVDFNKVITALDNLGQKLRQSGANYTTIEEANRQSASKIISSLNG
jgi:WXG100 family type VII secretion target